MSEDWDKVADEFLESEPKYKIALRGLLDWQQKKENRQIALRARMGTSKSYLMSVSLGWVAEHVRFARQLPVFNKHRQKGSDKIIINDTTIAYLQQREPDYSRQLPMALYLAIRKHHKFPPLLLVAYRSWVYDKKSDEWGKDERALEPSLKTYPLDSNSFLVDLDTTNTYYYAFDGQHRLMAIKGLRELLDGRLNAKKRDNSATGKSIALEEIENYYDESGFDIDELHGMLDNELIGIEVIPAVQDRETYEEAVSRLRNVFVDVNENAKRLESGELSMLDENDGFRIIARTLMTKHQLFVKGDQLRVGTKSSQLSEKSEHYTTLNTIVNIARGYLGQAYRFANWGNPIFPILDAKDKSVGLMRPEVDEIGAGLDELGQYFTALKDIPSHRSMLQGAPVSKLRRDNSGNILFRPIAQTALARAISCLLQKEAPDLDLGYLIKKLADHEELEDLRLKSKETPWFGVLCDPITGKIRRQKFYEILCGRMFSYLLGGGIEDTSERERLRVDFFNARTGSTESVDSKAYNMDGALVKYENFFLPNPWQ